MIPLHAEHLVAHVPGLLKPAVFVVHSLCATHTGSSDRQFKGRAVGVFGSLADVVSFFVQPEGW